MKDKLKTLQYESTILTEAVSSFNSNKIAGSGLKESITDRNKSIQEYETSTLILNYQLSTSMGSEINSYLNIMQQISTHVMYDISIKTINDSDQYVNDDKYINDKVSSLLLNINTVENYIKLLKSESVIIKDYITLKNIYELESSNLLNTSNPADRISESDYSILKLQYDIYVSQLNKSITTRNVFNTSFNNSNGTDQDSNNTDQNIINVYKCEYENEEKNNNIVQGVYELKALSLFSRCSQMCPTIQLYIRNDSPLVIKYNVADMGSVHLILSPINNDDQCHEASDGDSDSDKDEEDE